MAAMSKEKSEVLRTVVMWCFTAAMKDAIHLVGEPNDVVERELVPYWEQAVHAVLVRVGACSCPECREDPPPDEVCFMEMSRTERLAMFPPWHQMSYREFLKGFHMGVSMAFAELAGTAPEEEQ
jgi:hypothetical protein